MNAYYCKSCLLVVKVIGDPMAINGLIKQHPRWKPGHPCVGGCGHRMERIPANEVGWVIAAAEQGAVRMYELTPEQFFSAMCGFGLPEEISIEPESVVAFLKSAKVVDVKVETSPTGRVVLHQIDLENGLSLHLSSSSYGPTIFKITRRKAQNADHDHGEVPTDPDEGALQVFSECGSGGGGSGDGDDHLGGVQNRIDDGGHGGPSSSNSESVSVGNRDHDSKTDEGAGKQTAVAGASTGRESGGGDSGE